MTTRRSFIQGMGAAGLALGGLTACGGGKGGGGSAYDPQTPKPIPSDPILVVVMFDGGQDWLNLMVPTAGANASAYVAARSNLKIDPGSASDMTGGVSLNNDFLGMIDLHNKGRVAWVPGIGMPSASLSHFTATDLWAQGGVLNSTGWLGRFADQAFSPTGDVLRGIVTTGDVPLMFRGATRDFVAITGSSGFVYPSFLRKTVVGTPYSAQALEDGWGISLTTASPDPVSQPGYDVAAMAGKAFFDAQNSEHFAGGGTRVTG